LKAKMRCFNFDFQGMYRLNNMTLSDSFLPPALKTRFFAEFKLIGKFAGFKSAVNFTTWTAFGEVRKPLF
jgi:hypothetical protein